MASRFMEGKMIYGFTEWAEETFGGEDDQGYEFKDGAVLRTGMIHCRRCGEYVEHNPWVFMGKLPDGWVFLKHEDQPFCGDHWCVDRVGPADEIEKYLDALRLVNRVQAGR